MAETLTYAKAQPWVVAAVKALVRQTNSVLAPSPTEKGERDA